MLENATRICEAKFGNLFLYEGGVFRTAALYGAPPAWAEARRRVMVARDLHPDTPSRPRHPNQENRPYRRRQDDAGLYRARSELRVDGRDRWRSYHSQRADAQGG